MEYRIATAGRRTGRLLEQLVGPNPVNAVVCYGVGYSGPLPALNANCSRLNKLEQAHRLVEGLRAQAVLDLNFEQARTWLESHQTPVLGRSLVHSQGRDIIPILEEWQLEATRGICDFYTPYTPSVGEYRTWVYRNRHLGTYKKVLEVPADYKRLGRNYKNGFRFQRVENDDVPDEVKALARSAVRTLVLDFGAVDILELRSGEYLVLEVNSAPGVVDSRRAVINNLAHRVQRWAANGCPGRQDAE